MISLHGPKTGRARCRGQSLTEFVLLAPLFTALLFATMQLSELGIYKLKAQEIARYTAWTMAVRPLSDFENFDHDKAFKDARKSAIDELKTVYPDLDGAFDPRGTGSRSRRGKSGMLLSAAYVEPTENAGRFATRMTSGISAKREPRGLFGGGGGKASKNFNKKGMITGSALILLNPTAGLNPRRERQRQELAAALSKEGGRAGADMSKWNFRTNTPLREYGANGRRQVPRTVLIVDPWRLETGESVHPENRKDDLMTSGVAQVLKDVTRVSDGKPILFARPYSKKRANRGDKTDKADTESGRAPIFNETEGDPENSAVATFETLPMFEQGAETGYRKSFKARGPNFMGCPKSQKRRCWKDEE